MTVNTSIPLSLVHLLLAHLNYSVILKMNKLNAADGLKLDRNPSKPEGVCEGCIFGKMHRNPFPRTGRRRATMVGQIIHSDTGFVPVKTPGGESCYVILKDDYSSWTSLHLMTQKSEAENLFIKFAAFVKTTTGNDVMTLRTDDGTEYGSNRFKNWLENSGIVHQTTTAYTPQQNGVSERMNRTAMESARSSMYMRTNKETDKLWGEFLRSAIYVLNRSISKKSSTTPFELFFGRKPNLENPHVICCRANAHVPDKIRKKLDSKARPCWHTEKKRNAGSYGTQNQESSYLVAMQFSTRIYL